jgi:hypothetical protein
MLSLLANSSSRRKIMENLLEQPSYTPHFSGHETFPLKQMWLKKSYDQKNSDNTLDKSVFTKEDAIGVFGVGKNMVSSVKHWSLACGLLEESSNDKGIYLIPKEWDMILNDKGLDPYCENPSTAWLTHWRLAGLPAANGKHRSTTWGYIFNNITSPSFSRDSIVERIKDYTMERNLKISESTLKRDVETCIRSYCPKSDNNIEENAEPLLAELGLIQEESRGLFSFKRGPKFSLSDYIFIFALTEFWESLYSEASTLSFETIAYGPSSPGRVFKLDEDSVAEKLVMLEEKTSGLIKWSDSSGIRQVVFSNTSAEQLDRFKNSQIIMAYGDL